MDELDKELIRHFAKDLLEVDHFKDKLKLKWINRSAALLANRLYVMLRSPDTIDREVKGYTKWKDLSSMFYSSDTSDNTYTEVIVADIISRVHFVPATHMDYLAMSIKITLSEDTIKHLNKISDSLRYEDNVLTSESDFPGAIIAKFAIVKRVNEGKLNISDARDTYRIWLKICYDEWWAILHGADIPEAKLTQVLEKYILVSK
jgi:hypothetical protein